MERIPHGLANPEAQFSQQDPETLDDETKGHHGDAGAYPRKKRAFVGQVIAGLLADERVLSKTELLLPGMGSRCLPVVAGFFILIHSVCRGVVVLPPEGKCPTQGAIFPVPPSLDTIEGRRKFVWHLFLMMLLSECWRSPGL